MSYRARQIAVVFVSLILVGCVADGTISSKRIELSYQQISKEQADDVVERSNDLLEQIENYVGTKLDRNITIKIFDFEDDNKAHAIYSKNLVEIPVTRFRGPQLDYVLAHEIGHLVAGPSFLGSSLLNEGVAVHLHSKFSEFRSRGGNIIDVHKTVARIISRGDYVSLSTLLNDNMAFRTYASDRRASLSRSRAYIQAGSFVKYLAETYGMAKFMRAYRDAPFDIVYGKSMKQLELDWLQFLREI